MCCCTKTLDFCSVGTCENANIDFGILAKGAGLHKLVTDFLGVEFSMTKEFALDEPIIFPTNALNENYRFVVQLFNPDNEKIIIERAGVQYDCFQFQTKQSYAIT